MNKNKLGNIFFVIGPCGVGKSTLLPLLTASLVDGFAIHDFDERGVPDQVDKSWRLSETEYWLEVAQINQARSISTVVCGFIKPDEIVAASQRLGLKFSGCFLDVDDANLEKRLLGRYVTKKSVDELRRTTTKTVAEFVQNNIYVTPLLREASQKHDFEIVDTSTITPEQVAERVLSWIKSST